MPLAPAALVLALIVAGPPRQDPGPEAARPGVAVTVDASEVPELAPWGEEARALIEI